MASEMTGEIGKRMRSRYSEAILVAFYFLQGTIVMLLAHSEFVQKSALAERFAAAISSVVWSISSLVEISAFPQIARLTLSVMWVFVPVVSAVLARSISIGPTYREGGRAIDLIAGLGFFCMFFAIAVYFPPILGGFGDGNRPYQVVTQWMAQSKLVFLMIATAWMIFATVFLTFIYLCFYRIWKKVRQTFS